ncbi:MAG: membrane protein insertase YidC, partial [Bacteroidetes bacterium]|nr:membrane protein insertase YidC [Bacteroidota bacterium]
MNEGKSQYIGIILISVLVYLLLLRFFKTDSTEAQDQEQVVAEQIDSTELEELANTTLISEDSLSVMSSEDSLAYFMAQDQALVASYGAFAAFAEGEAQNVSLENDLIKISFNSKGAQVESVELKEFKTFDQQPLMLIDKSQVLNYDLNLASGQKIATKDLYFAFNSSENAVVFTADLANGEALEITYRLNENSYLVDYDVEFKSLQKVLSSSDSAIHLSWNYYSLKQEQDISSEKTKSTAYWKLYEGDVEHLGIGKSKDEDISSSLNWLSFKQRFFNTSLIHNLGFESAELSTTVDNKDSSKVAEYRSDLALAYSPKEDMQLYSMQFFFFF